MDISTLISSSGRLQLSAAESKIPWEELAFSQRMLENHLSQDDDWASRRQIVIEQQVGWIARQLLVGARTLDIGCGPGLYTHLLAERGYCCHERCNSDPHPTPEIRSRGESALLIQESLWSLLRQLWILKSYTSRE